jgi:arylsulfatase A-like enzyme
MTTVAGPTHDAAGPGTLRALVSASLFGAVLVAAANSAWLAASVDVGRVRESEPLRSARLVLEERFDLNPLVLLPDVVNAPFELDTAGPFLCFLALEVVLTAAAFLAAVAVLAPALALLRRSMRGAARSRAGRWAWERALPLAGLAGFSFPAVLLGVRMTVTASRPVIALTSFAIGAGLWLALLLATGSAQRVHALLRACFGVGLAAAGLVLASAGVVVLVSSKPAQPPARPGAPNVLLISIDSLRADHLGCYGYRRDTSPSIDRLAREGALFRTVVSPTSWTLPAHLTLLTAQPPPHHGVTGDMQRLRPEAILLSETLWEAGYATAGFVSAPYLDAAYGYSQGFDHYDDYSVANRSDEASRRGITSPRLFGIVSEWLSEWDRGQRRRPFFAFVHMWDVHYDYAPPPPYDTMFDPDYRGTVSGDILGPAVHARMDERDLAHVIALYDGEIRFTDGYVGRLVQQLEQLGVADDTIIVVTADHGEEFFEHGNKGHRPTLYDEALLVPLVVRYPAQVPPGVVVGPQVRLMDVAPTILALAGVPRPAAFGTKADAPHAACDLTPWIVGGPPATLPPLTAFSDLLGSGLVPSVAAVRTQTQKFIQVVAGDRREERYDLSRDPGERVDLAGADAGADGALRSELAAWFAAWRDHGALARPVELDAAHLERLRALGYAE